MSLPLAVGASSHFRKTVSESDVYLFAGITGDFSPNHVDEDAMQRSGFGGRIAHGALIVGYMSATSTRILEGFEAQRAHHTPVSLGYDRIRLLAPVHIGDTIEIIYTIVSVDPERLRTIGDIVVTNQHGMTVAVAQHILKFVPNLVQSESGGSV
ncbi:MAG: hypothetical protein RI997_1536 [Pseudomonadota bacterium]|jgi:acyl dehydratase